MFPVNLNPRAYEASMIPFPILKADRHTSYLIHKQMLEVILMTIIHTKLKLLRVSFGFL
jgi:hypothetical protein